MAFVYILYSEKLNRFYTGSCLNLHSRINEHLDKKYSGFTSNVNDWKLFLSISELDYKQARNIEGHIKKMKSKRYIENLKQYPELVVKLVEKYK